MSLQLANKLLSENKLQEAMQYYRKLIEKNPLDAALWANYAVALRKAGHLQEAVSCNKRSLALDAEKAGTYGNLGNVLKDLCRFDEAIEAHKKALELAPKDESLIANYAYTLREACCFDEALGQIALAKSLTSNNKYAHYEWEEAFILLYQKRFSEAWPLYEKRFAAQKLPKVKTLCPQWQGEDLSGKHLLLIEEQGFGDTLIASRFIPQLVESAASISMACKEDLRPLFSELGIQQFCTKETAHSIQADYHINMMSLLALFNIDESNIPRPAKLYIPEDSKEKFAYIGEEFKSKKKVGIVWSGSVTFAGNAHRAVSLDQFLALTELPDIQLFSLQKGPKEKELSQHAIAPLIENLAPKFDSFADTAAAIEQLDLIVMTDSSVAHLAATLGKPVINLLQYKPYWLYGLAGDSCPWYNSMRFIRQSQPGDWQPVFDELRLLLQSDKVN